MAINSFYVTVYYNIIIAWCLFYLFASFRRKLQWSDCGNWWNTARCWNAGARLARIQQSGRSVFVRRRIGERNRAGALFGSSAIEELHNACAPAGRVLRVTLVARS